MKNYITGFIFSILLTLAAYFAVTRHMFNSSLVLIIIGLALLQFWVQLTFFLHLNQKSERWNLVVLVTTISIVLTLVVGSLWIMNNLNYHHPTGKTDQQILHDEAIYK
jgi:cytochrome o ubiquinol oxidase operon protein cyoD